MENSISSNSSTQSDRSLHIFETVVDKRCYLAIFTNHIAPYNFTKGKDNCTARNFNLRKKRKSQKLQFASTPFKEANWNLNLITKGR